MGRVADRAAGLESETVERLEIDFDGIIGDAHHGATRASCLRVKTQYPVGTEIRNTRQISIVSREELDAIARAMQLDDLPPDWLGASLVLQGIPDLTLLPPSSRLVFDGGASLVVDMENAPCSLPARVIEARSPGRGVLFKPAARHQRGITAWVERPGSLEMGATCRLHTPPQRIYPHL